MNQVSKLSTAESRTLHLTSLASGDDEQTTERDTASYMAAIEDAVESLKRLRREPKPAIAPVFPAEPPKSDAISASVETNTTLTSVELSVVTEVDGGPPHLRPTSRCGGCCKLGHRSGPRDRAST